MEGNTQIYPCLCCKWLVKIGDNNLAKNVIYALKK